MMPKSILIIDTDRNLRHSLALVLHKAGYRVETTGGAAEALTYLKTGRYDLVILEMMVRDGNTILLPRLLHLYPSLPVVVLTSHASLQTDAEIGHHGEHARLVKPVTPEALLEQVRTSLHQAMTGSSSNLEKQPREKV